MVINNHSLDQLFYFSVAQLCPTLCDPMDYSLPGSSLHGIFQARVLEWIAVSFSGDLLDPGIEPWSPALQADSLPFALQGSPRLQLPLESSKIWVLKIYLMLLLN